MPSIATPPKHTKMPTISSNITFSFKMRHDRIETQNGLVSNSTNAVPIEMRVIEKFTRPKVSYPATIRMIRSLYW